MDNIRPFVVAIWCGESKPTDINQYLREFVDEMKDIISNGISVNDHSLNVSIGKFIFDLPARAQMKGTVNFNHRNGCQKCDVTGQFRKRMSFPNLDSTKRTDESFRQRAQPSHHKEYSILEELPIKMVEDFVIDPLHAIESGVTKLLNNIWMKGATLYDAKFNKHDIKELDAKIFQANKEMPTDIHRKVRGISCMSYWKGTEFRAFLLYVGVVVLKDHLPIDAYEHFLLLFCAVRLCYCEKYSKHVDLAGKLFQLFVKNFILIYGEDHVVNNVHSLIHIVDDVKRFGNFNKISAYKYENCLGHLKRRVQSRGAAIEQIAHRLVEGADFFFKSKYEPNIPSWQPSLKFALHEPGNTKYTKYRYIKISANTFLSTRRNGDRFFLTKDKKVVQMNYAFYSNNDFFISGEPFLQKTQFFSEPFNSEYIDIYSVNEIKGNSINIKIANIQCKLLRLSYRDRFIFMPILHTLDELSSD